MITTFLGAAIMSTERPLPLNRVYLLNPGQTLEVGDRLLTGLRPPLFDYPATVGFYDDGSRTSFSSDCFGAPMPTAELATCDDVGHVPAAELRAAQLLWATVDSPWVHTVDHARYLATFAPLRAMDPALILSTSPGIIMTPLARDELTGPRGEGYRRMIDLAPARRAGTPDEVGNVGALLMGPDGAFITGSDFLMDGGVTASYFYGALAPQ